MKENGTTNWPTTPYFYSMDWWGYARWSNSKHTFEAAVDTSTHCVSSAWLTLITKYISYNTIMNQNLSVYKFYHSAMCPWHLTDKDDY